MGKAIFNCIFQALLLFHMHSPISNYSAVKTAQNSGEYDYVIVEGVNALCYSELLALGGGYVKLYYSQFK